MDLTSIVRSTPLKADMLTSESFPILTFHPDVSNPGSFEDVVELLIPELQRRGIYWDEYAVPGGTARENLHGKLGERLLVQEHPGAKQRWDTLPLPTEENVSSVETNDVVSAPAAESGIETKKAELSVTVGLVKDECKAAT